MSDEEAAKLEVIEQEKKRITEMVAMIDLPDKRTDIDFVEKSFYCNSFATMGAKDGIYQISKMFAIALLMLRESQQKENKTERGLVE